MSSMAFAMYQFTKGEGRLNTTQDLFTQAEYFAEEANRLYKIVRQFSYQVTLTLLCITGITYLVTADYLIWLFFIRSRCLQELRKKSYWNI